MTDSPYITEGNPENFDALVIQQSFEVPVLVDFWAAWCQPCQMLLPIVSKLAKQYQGKFRLVKVNSDEQQQLAMEYGVRSLPTLKLFRNGQIVEEIMGAQPESVLRELLDQYIERESDKTRDQALQLAQQGDIEQARRLLQQAAADDPDNLRIIYDLARIAMISGDAELAEQTIQSLPVDQRHSDEANEIMGQIPFVRAAAGAPDRLELAQQVETEPDNLTLRYQLAAVSVLTAEYETALEQLLTIMKKDRKFDDDAGRKGLLAIFDILHGEGELVTKYRRQMFNLLH